ncbi:MAG TPA: SH3-like domain-containing protein [Chloroflexota bacterium]|jgi:nitrile hydratase
MNSAQPRFAVGRRVRVLAANPAGNPRTPEYIRGKTGVIAEIQGVIDNPIDHRGHYPPLYSVVFAVRDVFGGTSRDQLSVDLHEDWLEPA